MRSSSVTPKRKALLESRAALMRSDISPPEVVLWRALVNRKLGAAFRRQVVIAGYICDFVCASHRLVIEVDGAQHAPRVGADSRRDACLARLGYRVLRIEARGVLGELPSALERIREAVGVRRPP